MPGVALPHQQKVDKFLDNLEFNLKYSSFTIRNYSHYLRRFVEFSTKSKVAKLSDLDETAIKKYENYLNEFKLSPKTLGFHLIALRSFLKWLKKDGENVIDAGQIIIPKVEATKLVFLHGQEVERLFSFPDTNKLQGKRDRAILELFYATGLRLSELTSLNRNSLNEARNEIKTTKKMLFLPNRAISWLKTYLEERKDNSNALFVSSKGKVTRLTPRSVERMLKKYTRKANLPNNITPKALRHSFATDLLQAGAEVGSVQKMLGHKNISSTQRYIHT